MARYTIITLVDITRTNPTRAETDKLKISQQANFNSLLQAIGLRSNITWDTDPKMFTGKLPDPLDGKANHWTWTFDTERDDVFLSGTDPVALLLEDLHGVPITDQLNNSVELDPAAFISKGNSTNIWLQQITQ